MRESNELTDEVTFEDIGKYLWKMRKLIVVIVVVLTLFLAGSFAVNGMRRHNIETGAFTSANLDRTHRGVYRLRVETMGDRSNPRREDTVFDFDRDINITVALSDNGLLELNLENEHDDFIIETVRLRGILRHRGEYNFRRIYLSVSNVASSTYTSDSGYSPIGLGVPLAAYRVSEDGSLDHSDWELLADVGEFRENFELELLEIGFYELDNWYNDRNLTVVKIS